MAPCLPGCPPGARRPVGWQAWLSCLLDSLQLIAFVSSCIAFRVAAVILPLACDCYVSSKLLVLLFVGGVAPVVHECKRQTLRALTASQHGPSIVACSRQC